MSRCGAACPSGSRSRPAPWALFRSTVSTPIAACGAAPCEPRAVERALTDHTRFAERGDLVRVDAELRQDGVGVLSLHRRELEVGASAVELHRRAHERLLSTLAVEIRDVVVCDDLRVVV